jgi:hypothetical protein
MRIIYVIRICFFMAVHDYPTGKEIADIAVLGKDGRKIKPRDIAMIPGPGAPDETIKRLLLMAAVWEEKQRKGVGDK